MVVNNLAIKQIKQCPIQTILKTSLMVLGQYRVPITVTFQWNIVS